uniref:hypothetical protein n=1 Tax=Deinococcus sp. TaxID=47478 RepID=UPI0025BF3148
DGAAVVFTRAGRVRGHSLAKELGVSNKVMSVEELAPLLNVALGANGTRLCAVLKSYQEGDKVIIETNETVCSAGEEQGSSRRCTFTLGAVQGALEEITGKTYLAEQTDSVLAGQATDKFEFSEF